MIGTRFGGAWIQRERLGEASSGVAAPSTSIFCNEMEQWTQKVNSAAGQACNALSVC